MKSKDLYEKYNEGKHWYFHSKEYVRDFILLLKEKKINGIILDAGCGSGRDTQEIRKNEFNVIGIDNSKVELDGAKSRFQQCKFELGDLEKLQIENDSISGIFCINVIHYVDKEKVLNEFLRVLRKKGILFIHFNLKIKDESGKVDYFQKESEIMNLIKDFNLINIKRLSRLDEKPHRHTHQILEIVLEKP